MTSIVVNPHDKREEEVLLAFLKSLDYDFEPDLNDEKDTTEYLLSSERNRVHLMEGIEQIEKGEVVEINLEELCK